MCLPGLDGLNQGVVYEAVLLLSLYQAIPLGPDVLQEGEDVEVTPGQDLLEHRVDDDVAAGPDKGEGAKGREDHLPTPALQCTTMGQSGEGEAAAEFLGEKSVWIVKTR